MKLWPSNTCTNRNLAYLKPSQQTFLVFQDVFSATLFVFQDLLKTSWRRIYNTSSWNIFKKSCKTSSRRFQDVSKTCLQDVLQLCLEDVLEDKKILLWRRLEDVLKTSSVRLHHDECLLSWIILNIHPAAYLEPCHIYQNKSTLYNTENSEPWHIDNPEIFRNLKYSKQHIFRTLSKIQDRVFCKNS